MKNFYQSMILFFILAILTLWLYFTTKYTELEIYYININNVQLAIPKIYANAGGNLNVYANRKTILKEALNPPGSKLSEFYMLLDFEDLKPWPKHKNNTTKPNYMRIWLADPSARPKERQAESIKKKLTLTNRVINHDAYGLVAYNYVTRNGVMVYKPKSDGTNNYIMACGGFDLPNPLCTVSSEWNGILLEYQFQHIHLPEWNTINLRITNLMNSFTH